MHTTGPPPIGRVFTTTAWEPPTGPPGPEIQDFCPQKNQNHHRIREVGLTGVQERTVLVRMGLEALIAQESAQRLANLGGTEKRLRRPPRRRMQG